MVSSWCRVLPDNAQHNRQIAMPPVGSSTGDFESWLKVALEVERLSLYGNSVKGTWREGSFAGDPGG